MKSRILACPMRRWKCRSTSGAHRRLSSKLLTAKSPPRRAPYLHITFHGARNKAMHFIAYTSTALAIASSRCGRDMMPAILINTFCLMRNRIIAWPLGLRYARAEPSNYVASANRTSFMKHGYGARNLRPGRTYISAMSINRRSRNQSNAIAPFIGHGQK